MFKKKESKYSYETGRKAGQLAPLGHASPARLTLVLEHLDKHPPPNVPEDAQRAAGEAVKQALKALDYDIIDLRVEGMMGLAEWISNAFGPPAEALGYELRNERLEETAPALTRMVKVLNEKEPKLHRVMLMILSNLVSDAFDKRSGDTKRLLESANIFPRLVEFVYDDADIIAQVYACACLQNLCQDLAFARLLRSFDVVEELERLCGHSANEHVRRYAAGALFNCVESIHREVEANKNEEKSKLLTVKQGKFGTEDEGKTRVDILEQLVNGHKVMWLANKPARDFEGTLKIVAVVRESRNLMASQADESGNQGDETGAVGARVKLEGGAAFANYEKEQEESEDGTKAKKKKGRSLASSLFGEDDDEMNLPEHVLAQLAKREMAHLGEQVRNKHATTIMQSYAKGWKARREQRLWLEELKATKAMQLAARFINAKTFRRRRGLLVSCTRLVQAYWRAQVAARYGLCTRRAALLMICVFRDMHDRVCHRRLTAEINVFYLERQAVWKQMRADKQAKKVAEEAEELSRQIAEAEERGEALPEGLVSGAVAATVKQAPEVLGVTARIPLYDQRQNLGDALQLRAAAAALGPPTGHDVGSGRCGGGGGGGGENQRQTWSQPLRTPLPPRPPRLDSRLMQAASAAFVPAAPYSPMSRSPTYSPKYGPGFARQQQQQQQQQSMHSHSVGSYGACYGAGRMGPGSPIRGSPMTVMSSGSMPTMRVPHSRNSLPLSPSDPRRILGSSGGGQGQGQSPCALPAAGGMSSAQRVLQDARDSTEARASDSTSPAMRRAASTGAQMGYAH